MSKIIFMGNGPLAEYALKELKNNHEIIFHARSKEDLTKVKKLKQQNPDAYGVLASFGVMIKDDVLGLFEPEGILNIHPSLLPKYRGPSPIETAMKNGDKSYGVSIMKLVKAMDAGPVYRRISYSHQNTIPYSTEDAPTKDELYQSAAESACSWLNSNLDHIRSIKPILQGETGVTYTQKLDKTMSNLDNKNKTALELLYEIRAFKGFPKSTTEIYDKKCIVHSAHLPEDKTELTNLTEHPDKHIVLHCKDDTLLVIDCLQPENKKPMDAKSFINGYGKEKH